MRRTTNIYTHKGMMQARLMAAGAAVPVLAATWAAVLLLRQPTVWGFILVVLCAAVVAVGVALVLVNVWRSGLFWERGIRHRFMAVCREKGLAARTKTDKGEHWRYPRMRVLSGSSASVRLLVRPLPGQSHKDWERAADAIAMHFGVAVTHVRYDGSGTLTLVIGHDQLPAHDFEHNALEAVEPDSWAERLAVVEVGKGEGGQSFTLPLLGSHILIAGITGAGKGSVVWTIILRLLPAIKAGVVRCHGIDPKRMELSIGRPILYRYAATPEAMVAEIEQLHGEMQARADELAGKVRKFTPSSRYPLVLIVVDELGYLVSLLPDRKQREQVEKMLAALLVLGRACGYVVLGAIQDPRKETLSFRDLFPTRIAMRLPKPMVDLVLGNGMYEAGAVCDQIPATAEHGAGVAFVVDETSTLPAMLRVPWCSDEAIKQAAAELAAPQSPPRLELVT